MSRFLEDRWHERIEHKRTFTRSTHADDRYKAAQREPEVNLLEVPARGTAEHCPAMFQGSSSRFLRRCEQVLGGQTIRMLQCIRRALETDLASLRSRTRADLNDSVGMMKQIGLVFDQDHRVPAVDQSTHRLGNALGVARMQADGRFVEHVQHIDQVRAEQIRQVDSLGFATTEGVHGAR